MGLMGNIRRMGLIGLMSLMGLGARAQEDSVAADFFRRFYHQGHLVHWLDSYYDRTVYQGLHLGQWDESGQLMFSVDGNSFRWNRYYIDGFRVDNRFTAGSTSYVPNMDNYDLSIDPRTSSLRFELDTLSRDYASASFNRGGLGGINKTTEGIIHLFHGTGTEGAYDKQTIHRRQYAKGQGTADVAYTIRDKQGRGYRQHLYASIGQQQYPNYDQNGLIPSQPLYPANYYKVQMDGRLPSGRWFDRMGYLLNFSGKDNYGAEFYYNRNEVMQLRTYSASLYGRRKGLTTGLTWAANNTRHDDLQFRRNIIDQDGESLEPWMADGTTQELTWFVDYERPLVKKWLRLKAEGYNSMLHFSPTTRQFSNEVYLQHMLAATPTPLYRYDWTSSAFASGLLENRVGMEARHSFKSKLTLSGTLAFTLDGMVLRDRTKITPNAQARFSFDYRPAKWFQLGLTVAHDRVSYNIEDIRYMSRDYMNANVYFSGTSTLFTTTGGRYHRYAKHLAQPAHMTFDLPIRFHFGRRHEIALLQTFKKFYHTWMTQFEGGAAANGFTDANDYYFLTPGEHNYVVGYTPTSMMGGGFFNNTPYYMSQTARYTYTGRKVVFSLSWQSMMGVGLSALGNGPAANNIGVLSESTANPNTQNTIGNPNGKYKGVGRLDQDKAYVARIYLAYNVCKWFQFGFNLRWTDGQPFVFFNTATNTDAAGNTQMAMRPHPSRGINPTNGNFGCRESALFDIDLHARFQWEVKGHPMSLAVMCYNIYDFGNVYNEMCFPEGAAGPNNRGHNMTLTIPRGIIGTLKIEI